MNKEDIVIFANTKRLQVVWKQNITVIEKNDKHQIN